LLEPEPVDRSRSRLIHDPANDRSALRVVLPRSAPDIRKHVERDFFGALAVVADANRQREYQAIGSFVQYPQSLMITRGDRLNETDPGSLWNRCRGTVGIEKIAERGGWLVRNGLRLPPLHSRP
jgi:hypothetical protein